MSDEFEYHYQAAAACYEGEVKTPFATQHSLKDMKAMLADAKPSEVQQVADAWMHIHKRLAGDDGGPGTIKGDLDKTVEHISQHWTGEAAEGFKAKAARLSKQLSDSATWAKYTGTAMDSAGKVLSDVKPQVEAMEEPSAWSRAVDKISDLGHRDDEYKADIHDNAGAKKALEDYETSMSKGKETQLKAAAKMETLARTYNGQTQSMGSWNKVPISAVDKHEDYPGHPGGVAPVPLPVGPIGSGPGSVAGSPGRRGAAAGRVGSGGDVVPPGAATDVDGMHPTHGGHAAGGGTATAPGGRGGAGGGAATGGGAAPGEAPGPVIGGPGRLGVRGRGVMGRGVGTGAGAGRGAAAAAAEGEAAEGAAGRGGAGTRAGGMGGMGSGAGGMGGGKGGARAGGRGPLARTRGGVAGAARGARAPESQGGEGLHSSRGGSLAGRNAVGGNAERGGAMAPGAGGVGAGGGKDKEKGKERPDYLVEDEETWLPPDDNITPPTIK